MTIVYAEGVRSDTTTNKQGQYAMHVAAIAGHEDAVVYLLKNMGADINCRDSEGRTPAMLAAKGDHLAVLKVLLFRGADVRRIRDNNGAYNTAPEIGLVFGLKSMHFC